jgi:ABC-type Fe3+/spermidine/putrescine transport system ATPase subunit
MGSPPEIYDFPSTEFVATFVGQPNFFDGTIGFLSPDSITFISEQGMEFMVQPRGSVKRGESGRLVIRPEKISINKERQGKGNSFEGEVLRAIYLGELTKYLIEVRGIRLLANSVKFISEGSRIWVEWDKEDHFIIQ